MSTLQELWKIGSSEPLPADLVEGGFGVDTTNKALYSKDVTGNVFKIGSTADAVDWSGVINKPDPTISLSLTGDVSGSSSVTLTDLSSGNISISTTIEANSVTLGTDTVGNYVANNTAGTGIEVSGTPGEGWSPTISLSTVGNAGTYTKITTDTYGRVSSGTTLSATDIPNLDASKITTGTIDPARLPSYVDDVLEFVNLAAFPAIGEGEKIYIAVDANSTYRWTGSTYIQINSSVGSADTANKLATARTINDVYFDGSANIVIADSTKQPLDDDLTAIAALSGTSGLLKKTAANSWTLDTNTYVTSSGVTTVSGTAPIVSSGGATPAISISAATTSAAGSMSAADKTKLDGVATGATANVGTVTSVAATVSGVGLSISGSPITSSGTITITSNATPNTVASTLMSRDASGNFAANIFYGTATSANFADLAEKYITDLEYEEGTVLQINVQGESEGTLYNGGKLLGVVSYKPGLMINAESEGQFVCLKGKVPVKILEKVKKGQYVIAHSNGSAIGIDTLTFESSLKLIGIALEDSIDNTVSVKI